MCRSLVLPSIDQSPSSDILYDDSGKVVAVAGLKTTAPWSVVKSKNYEGRYFFLNSATNMSAWSLDPKVCGVAPSPNPKTVIKDNVEEKVNNSGGFSFIADAISPPLINTTLSSRGYPFISKEGSPFSLRAVDEDSHLKNEPHEVIMKEKAKSESSLFSGFPSIFRSFKVTPLVAPPINVLKANEVEQDVIIETPSTSSVSSNHPFIRKKWTKTFSAKRDSSDSSMWSFDEVDQQAKEEEEAKPVFMILDGLGQGGYATVVKVEHLGTKERFAMKVVAKDAMGEKVKKRVAHREQIENELRFMTEISPSPFLQKCHYAFESPSNVFFIIDLATGGDLFYHLAKNARQNKNFTEQEARILLSELYVAISHLHEYGIIHRDIKVENIMLDAQGHVKLVDYGLALELYSEVQEMKAMGSLIYMAPELIKYSLGGRFTDWWAYGVLAHELLTGNSPWSTLSNTRVIKEEIQSFKLDMPMDGVSSSAAKFVDSLMCQDSKHRLGTKRDTEVKNASFFKTIDWVKTSSGQASPAFTPEAVNVNKAEQSRALKKYYHCVDEQSRPATKTWSIGLGDSSHYLF